MIFNEGILARLPETEQGFLLDTALGLLREQEGDSLENLCHGVVGVFADKQYGWEEAILDRRWFRYPSEVDNQRFCSEEALKNFLLLRSLGVPAQYCVLEEYFGSSMAHEVVLVKDGERRLLLNWDKVSPVTVSDDRFSLENQEDIPFSALHILGEEEVLERVAGLRDGSRFLDAIECGQILFSKDTPEGSIDAYVHYDPDKLEVEFTFAFSRYTGGLKFYLAHRTFLEDGEMHEAQDFGICEHKLYDLKNRIPILRYQDGHAIGNPVEQFRFFDQLSSNQQRDLCVDVIYQRSSCDPESAEKGFIYSKEERETYLGKMRKLRDNLEIPEPNRRLLGIYVDFYDQLLTEKGDHPAARFMDYTVARIAFEDMFQSQREVDDFFRDSGINPFARNVDFVICGARDLGGGLSLSRALECSNVLTDVLSDKTSVPFKRCDFNQIFNVVQAFGNDSRSETYGW
jgi:hypothetical protein